jgi:iron(III) transport system permease protein
MSPRGFKRFSVYKSYLQRQLARPLLLGAAAAIFGICCVAPVVWMFFGTGGAGGLRVSLGALLDARQRGLLGDTVMLGLGTLACATAIGIPFGVALGRCDTRRVMWPRILLGLPLVFPSYVLALSWMLLFGSSASGRAYGLPASVLVLGFSSYPIVMLATEASLRQVASRLEDAARLVASAPRVWLRIVLPLMLPTLAASSLIVFVLAISDFAVPALLRTRVYTTEVFTAFAALYDFTRAAFVALPLIVVATLASLAGLELWRRPVVGRADHGPSATVWTDRTQTLTAALLGLAALVALGVPVGALVLHAWSGRAPLADALSGNAIGNSFLWSAIGASLIIAVGGLLAYWRMTASARYGHAADALLAALFAVPGTVLGVGVIALWNRPGWMGTIYRTDAIVIVGYLGRFLPLATLLCAAFLRRIPRGAEEASLVSGASWQRSLRRVVLPMAATGLAASWLIIFILIFGEVGVTILIAPPGESTIPVRAYTLIANSPSVDVARLALLQITISAVPIIGLAMLLREQKNGRASLT